MSACSSDLFVRSLLSLTALALLTQPARAQTDSTQAQDPTTAPVTSSLPPAPAPKAPVGPPNLAKMSPGQIANLAAYNIALASLAVSHYTYKEIEHNENFIDGQLVVNHTTVTENIFINNLPYMRKIMVDGKPLEGKELKAEQKLYDQAVKERRALDASARIAIEKHAVRTTSPNIDRLSTVFQLKLDGHQTIDGQDCVVLDAMPPAGNANPDLAQHIRIALEADTGDVLDVKVEFLADDNGFAKGSVLHTHYAIIGANALPDHQTWDTVVTFKELLGKPITIHRDITYIDYKRFRATVTIKSFSLADGKDPGPDSTPATPAPGPESPNPVAPGTASPVAESAPAEKPAPAPKLSAEEKAKLKADERAKADADAKARADERAEAKTKAEEEAKAKAEARAEAKAKADADAKAKAEELAQARADAKAKADAEAKALAEARAEAKAKADADARAKAEALAQAKADERARAKADANARAEAKAKSDALAKADAAETAKLKADLARSEAEEKAKMKAQAADLAKSEALAKAQLKEQAKEQTKLDAAAKAKAKADADAKAKTPPPTADAPSPTQPPSNNLH